MHHGPPPIQYSTRPGGGPVIGPISPQELEMHFADNYTDLSIQHGTGAGFQFQFRCECCNDAQRSPFMPFRSGRTSEWVSKFSGFMSSFNSTVSSEMYQGASGYADAKWGPAHDEAFKQAIASVSGYYYRCARCKNCVCGKCFSLSSGLCNRCAPDVAAEVEAARVSGTIAAASENARLEGERLGQKINVKEHKQLVCPQCRCEAHGGKFCPNCGFKLGQQMNCKGCNGPIPQGGRFCPECGTPAL